MLAPEPINKFCLQLARSARHPAERRNDESVADTVPFLPWFFRRKSLITVRVSFAHPTKEMRTSSLRETAATACHILPIQDNSQQIIERCRQTDLFSEVWCTSHLPFAETFTLARKAVRLSSPAACWLKNQQKHPSYVGCPPNLQVTDSSRAAGGWSIACSGRPLDTQHETNERDPEGNARTAGLGRPTASPLAKLRLRPQQRFLPAVTNAASRAALKW